VSSINSPESISFISSLRSSSSCCSLSSVTSFFESTTIHKK
jgi:hypothetical protein